VGSKLNLQNKSFSLLELIVTLGILSAGIVTVLQAFAFSARITGLSCDMVEAVFLGEDKIQELEFNESQDLIKNTPQDGRGTQDKFEWVYTLTPDPNLKLYWLDFTVSWTRARRNEGLDINTCFRYEK